MSASEYRDDTLIIDLIRAEVDPALINRVLQLMQMSSDVRGRLRTIEDIRSKWRENKKKWRGHLGGAAKNDPSSLSSSSKNPFKRVLEEEGREKERNVPPKSAPLHAHWEPSVAHFEEGAALGFSRDEVLDQAQDMRIWAGSNAHRAIARKPSWNLTFSGWMRRERKKFVGQTRRKAEVKANGHAISDPPKSDFLTPPPGCESLEAARARYRK